MTSIVIELPFPREQLLGVALSPLMHRRLIQQGTLGTGGPGPEVVVDRRLAESEKPIWVWSVEAPESWAKRKQEQRWWDDPRIRAYTHPLNGEVIDKDRPETWALSYKTATT